MSDETGMGGPGDFLPTLGALLLFTVLWGLVQYRDGTVFGALLFGPPLAAGMLSAATIRMVMGRSKGGVAAVGGIGIVVFAVMFAISAVIARSTAEEAVAFATNQLLLAFVFGAVGSFIGALSLNHYRISDQPADDEDLDEDDEADDGDDVDYTTQPEDLVCLLTNQVVNPSHDDYLVCHNKLNQTQACHAVYLMDYVHLLDGRCRRCYQQIKEKDLQGMKAILGG